MMDIISPDNTELLAELLSDENMLRYVECAEAVQQKVGELPQIDLPIFHHFAPNVYMRQMDAPAGAIVVSKMHRTEHMNILLKGSLSVITEHGIEHLKAPLILKSDAGTKRIGYFHEDSSWVTVHPTELTDLEEIEAQVIVPESEIQEFLKSLPQKEKALCHGEQ
ncbi:hypothetical protein AYL20_01265 [Acinetobacter venetianus]|uniref:hypothetical protein n=1 Tax=Acinetobacter venetianus TaxID=52133 RepID=UPI0007758E1B|nr:hypothetical protein [Acinetobacter venetianus]KXO82653.1 hypothetical protein AYL20_01265 [Acinetobacter venetianus]